MPRLRARDQGECPRSWAWREARLSAWHRKQTRAPNNVQFKVAGARDDKSNAIAGDIEAKYTPAQGVILTQTWTTTNVLKTQVELENQLAKGQSSVSHPSPAFSSAYPPLRDRSELRHLIPTRVDSLPGTRRNSSLHPSRPANPPIYSLYIMA